MEARPVKKTKLSLISKANILKLGARVALFLAGAVLYILSLVDKSLVFAPEHGSFPVFFAIVWVFYMAEMIERSFPVKIESMGCMKQFRVNYKPVEGGVVPDPVPRRKAAFAVGGAWLGFNALFGAAYLLHWIDGGILMLLALAYGICDVVCVLFFCPFQTFFMKNRCCTACHIYNWDYIMICTPFIFMPGVYTWTLLAVSLFIFLRWEITHYRHPERFYEQTNQSLKCANCTEKLCHHKKALKKFWIRQRAQLAALEVKLPETISRIEEKIPETINRIEEKIPEQWLPADGKKQNAHK